MSQRPLAIVRWFLAISYGVTAPVCAILEFRQALFSLRFDIPPWLLYLAAVAQLICVPLLFSRRWAAWAAGGLTVSTLGAIAGHLRIGSPQSAIAAVVFSCIQLWFVHRVRKTASDSRLE